MNAVFVRLQVTDLSDKTEKHFDQLEHTVEHKAEAGLGQPRVNGLFQTDRECPSPLGGRACCQVLCSSLREQDEKIHTRVDELTAKSEATFQSLVPRFLWICNTTAWVTWDVSD